MKICTVCKENKELSEYYSIKTGRFEVFRKTSECKNCRKIYRKSSKVTKSWSYIIGKRNYMKRWSKKHPHLARAKAAKRAAAKLQALPKWLTEAQLLEIKDIYKNCPKGYEVDHIVPLQGKSVRGLHVPWNLQYLTVSENRSKHNKL